MSLPIISPPRSNIRTNFTPIVTVCLSVIIILCITGVGLVISYGFADAVSPVKGSTAAYNATYTAYETGITNTFSMLTLLPWVLAAVGAIVAIIGSFVYIGRGRGGM